MYNVQCTMQVANIHVQCTIQVPHVYKLLGYKEFDVHDAATNYVPVTRDRPLRTGAEVKWRGLMGVQGLDGD